MYSNGRDLAEQVALAAGSCLEGIQTEDLGAHIALVLVETSMLLAEIHSLSWL